MGKMVEDDKWGRDWGGGGGGVILAYFSRTSFVSGL